MSVFTPVDKSLYQVYFSCTEVIEQTLILKTPSPFMSLLADCEIEKQMQSPKTPKKVKVIKRSSKNEKKSWSDEERTYAVQKAMQIGIAKALRILQNEYAPIYADLSPSTLQYWVAKHRKSIMQ